MKKLSVIIATVLFSFGVANAEGNDTNEASHGVEITIPTVALVDVESTDGEAGTINLTPDVTSLEAGNAVDFSDATDNSLWLNYTSIIGSEQDARNVTVEFEGDALPTGLSLLLTAGAASGNGNGDLGSSVEDALTLSTTAQNLITGIKSGYTGNGVTNGHQLTYSLSMNNDNFATLLSDTYDITVTYTITD